MTTLADVHEALAEQIRTGVARSDGINVSAWPNSSMPWPRIEIWPGDRYVGYYDLSDSDDGVMPITVRLRVEYPTDPESGFLVITELLTWDGPSSLRAAVMAGDRTLGGVVDDVVVLAAEWDSRPDDPFHAAWVPVDIVVSR